MLHENHFTMSLKRARDYGLYPMPTIFKSRRTLNTPYPTSTMNTSRGRTYNPYNSRANYYRPRRSGPYRALTGGTRHTNPVYPKPELKFYDADEAGVNPPANTPAAISNVGTVACLNQLTTGTGVQNFLGNQIAVKSISYRVELDLPAVAANQVPTSGRVVLIWDKQPNGTLAPFTSIFQAANYLSYINNNFRDRFVILRNDQFSLSPNGDQTIFFERNVKINMLTTFANLQGAAAVPQTGALLLAYIGDQATAANQPTINGWFRIRYYDN